MAGGRRVHPERGVVFWRTVLRKAEILEIRHLIRLHGDRTQTEIARRVCRHFGWYLPSGGLAARAVLDVLRCLAARGYIRLPRGQREAPNKAA